MATINTTKKEEVFAGQKDESSRLVLITTFEVLPGIKIDQIVWGSRPKDDGHVSIIMKGIGFNSWIDGNPSKN